MKTSLVKVEVKLVVKHPDNVAPEDIINECEYDFTHDDAIIHSTEITEVEDLGECDENGILAENEDTRKDEKHGLYPQHENEGN